MTEKIKKEAIALVERYINVLRPNAPTISIIIKKKIPIWEYKNCALLHIDLMIIELRYFQESAPCDEATDRRNYYESLKNAILEL